MSSSPFLLYSFMLPFLSYLQINETDRVIFVSDLISNYNTINFDVHSFSMNQRYFETLFRCKISMHVKWRFYVYVLYALSMFACIRNRLLCEMAAAVERTDDLVREYLLYRGFTSSLKHLDSEIKADKEKGFRVSI